MRAMMFNQRGVSQQIFQEATVGHSVAWLVWLASGRRHALAVKRQGRPWAMDIQEYFHSR
jgi:hypothetical protein